MRCAAEAKVSCTFAIDSRMVHILIEEEVKLKPIAALPRHGFGDCVELIKLAKGLKYDTIWVPSQAWVARLEANQPVHCREVDSQRCRR